MRDVDEGDAGRALNVLQLVLHILAELEIQGTERLIQQQHARAVDQRTGNGDALLLTARQGGHAAMLKALEVDQREHFLHTPLDFRLGQLFQPQTEGDVLIHIEMGKQRIFLEHRVDQALVGGKIVDLLPVEIHRTGIRGFEPADNPERGCLAAP